MRNFAVDLFCGAGGMTCGLAQAGYKVVAGVDKEIRCAETYTSNNTESKFLSLDLFPKTKDYAQGQQKIAIAKILEILQSHNFSKEKGDRLLLAICAPCQPFTKITKTTLSSQRKFNQARDKNLLLACIGIITKLMPDAIICENVEGISSENGVLEEFSRKLDKKGFSFDAKVINAANFGVPQRRRRTIGIGYNRKSTACTPTIPTKDNALEGFASVLETIGELPNLAAGESSNQIKNHRARALSDINLKRISCARPGESNHYLKNTIYGDLSLDCHQRMLKPSFNDTYTRMSHDKLAPTITTKFLSITNGRFGHYDTSQNRGLSLKEGALLQTFPDEYIFHTSGGMAFMAVLIGNAVPPKLANFFGTHIKKGTHIKNRGCSR